MKNEKQMVSVVLKVIRDGSMTCRYLHRSLAGWIYLSDDPYLGTFIPFGDCTTEEEEELLANDLVRELE